MRPLDHLYSLLPNLYRTEDKTGALRALIAIMEDELHQIEETIAASYDNLFIETCHSNKIAFIGDLIGAEDFKDAYFIANQRAYVGDLIALRKSKGTLSALEKATFAMTHWPCQIIEFYKTLSSFQAIAQPDLKRGQLFNLHEQRNVSTLGTPFDNHAHLMQVTHGPYPYKYRIPSIGLIVWRKQSYCMQNVQAKRCHDGYYTFHPAGIDTPLFNKFDDRTLWPPRNTIFPGPIASAGPAEFSPNNLQCSTNQDDIYKEDGGFFIWIEVKEGKDNNSNKKKETDKIKVYQVSLQDIQLINHTDYTSTQLVKNKVGVDVQTGRIVFGDNYLKKIIPYQEDIKSLVNVKVNYCYGFSTNLGSGPYARRIANNPDFIIFNKRDEQKNPSKERTYFDNLDEALERSVISDSHSITIEIRTNNTYTITKDLFLSRPIILQAASGYRPCIIIENELTLTIASVVTLSGLLLDGQVVVKDNAVLKVQDCTLVPRAHKASLTSCNIKNESRVCIQNSIIGPLKLNSSVIIEAENSIFDGVGGYAIAGEQDNDFGPSATSLKHITSLGNSKIYLLDRAHCCLFSGLLNVNNTQRGSIAYSGFPAQSQTPPRYQCYPPPQTKHTQESKVFSPNFSSLTYGHPGYAELKEENADFLLRGSEYQEEIGAFYGRSKIKKQAQIQKILEEYLPLGLEGKIIHAT